MWIKICGNTNLDDALRAAELGADAVGFVFAAGPRQVTPTLVSKIVPRLADTVEKIGVFSSRDALEIAETVRLSGLTGIQLHGGFDLQLATQLEEEFGGRVTIIQVLHWKIDQDASSAAVIAEQLKAVRGTPTVHRVLVDAKTETMSGGTGESYNWKAAREAVFSQEGKKLIAAGGLKPDNVRRAVEELTPWGVDVASGVEAGKGRKDPAKLKEFIEAARKID